jgi:hypothetical protein
MKATLKGRFDGDKASAATTLAVPAAGDLRFKASATEATFTNGPSLSGLTLTVEKPGAFLLDVKPHNKVIFFLPPPLLGLLHLPPSSTGRY